MTAGGWVWPVEPPMTRILVIGRAGQLATALAEADWPADVAVTCRGREGIDLAHPPLREAVIAETRSVINAAAYTAVDKAESEPESPSPSIATGRRPWPRPARPSARPHPYLNRLCLRRQQARRLCRGGSRQSRLGLWRQQGGG
jgi:hypothetical protein